MHDPILQLLIMDHSHDTISRAANVLSMTLLYSCKQYPSHDPSVTIFLATNTAFFTWSNFTTDNTLPNMTLIHSNHNVWLAYPLHDLTQRSWTLTSCPTHDPTFQPLIMHPWCDSPATVLKMVYLLQKII